MELTYFPLPRGPISGGVGVQGGWLITSYFGGRIDPISGRPGNHGGEDLAGAGISDKPLYAVVDGFVSQGWDPGGGGNWTTLYADDGSRFGYGHARAFAPGVNGKRVAAGTILAYVDSTGASTGAHLHFAYDGPDVNQSYDDPFDVLQHASDAGRFVGAPPGPPPPPPGDLTMGQYEDIMAGIARLEAAMGTNLSLEGQWEQDTRKVIINGVEQIVNGEAGHVTEAGWSSRPYPFRFGPSGDRFYIGSDGRRRIASDTEYDALTKVLLNPHLVELDATLQAEFDASFPVLNPA